MLVEFGEAAGGAIISTLDRVRADSAHTYGWQLNVGGPRNAEGIQISAGRERGRPFFQLTREDAYLKGWVVHPVDAEVVPSDPLRVTTRGKDADLWIVMATGRGAAPAAEVVGEGMGAVIQVGQAAIRYDDMRNRVVLQR